MFKKLLLILALICMIVLPVFSQTGNYTSNEYFYLPKYGAYGTDEYNEYNLYMEKADYQIGINKGGIAAIVGTSLPLYYLKTEINTLDKVETIYSKDIVDTTELATYCETTQDYLKTSEEIDWTADQGAVNIHAGNYTDTNTTYTGTVDEIVLTGTVFSLDAKIARDTELHTQNTDTDLDATFEATFFKKADSIGDIGDVDLTDIANLKILKYNSTSGNWECETEGGGATTFTGLTDTPVNYTGSSLKHVRVNVGETALEFITLAGGGDMLKATYDTDEDGDIDVAAGGTEKSIWTLYAIPYLSGTTAFGEIPIGTAEYCLTVNATATGYDYTELAFLANIVEDTTPQLGGQLQSGAHSINFAEQVLTSGAAIAWNLGNSNKAILTAAHNFTITITAPSGALNAQVIITQDATGSRIMDEIVTQSDAAIATTDVNITTEEITVTIDIPTGARIRFKTTAADLPAPLVVDTIYYAIRVSATVIKVATTKALAHAGTAIDLTDVGTGTHTVQQLVKWSGGTLGVLSTAAGSEDILSLTYKTADKQWYAQLAKDFK